MSDIIKVLAIDDAQPNLMIIKGCLRGSDFELKTATNAVDGLELFKSEFFDVVLLDVMMPGIDGFELRKILRSLAPERPIIFLTAIAEGGSMKMLNQIAWDPHTYYLNKVIDRPTLIKKIKEAVNIHRARQFELIHSNKIESNLKLAGELQRFLLPPWCLLNDDVIMAHYYLPTMPVSGDILDLIPLGKHRYLLFIGDIAGHGMTAALYMAAIQSYLQLAVNRNTKNLPPHELLNQLNGFFCNNLHSAIYMTAIAAVLDFKDNHMVMQSAGHPSLFYGSPRTGKFGCSNPNLGGVPIGWFKSTKYLPQDNFELDFSDDTVFFGYTDGVLDLENEDGKGFSNQQFQKLVQRLILNTPTPLLPFKCRSELNHLGYSVNNDDLMLVALSKRQYHTRAVEAVVPIALSEVAAVVDKFSSLFPDRPRQGAQVDLMLHEYLNNVIVHGQHLNQNNQGAIYTKLTMRPDGAVEIYGLDCGSSWDPNQAEKIWDGDLGSPARKTSGRGLQIMHELTDHIDYQTYCGLNESRFLLKNLENEK